MEVFEGLPCPGFSILYVSNEGEWRFGRGALSIQTASLLIKVKQSLKFLKAKLQLTFCFKVH